MNIERLDSKELASIGIRLEAEEETQAFADFINEELEVRIGQEISKRLTDRQLDEFDRCKTTDSARIFLERNCPEFRSIVQQQKDDFENEIIRYKSVISGAHLVVSDDLDKNDLPEDRSRDGSLMDDLGDELMLDISCFEDVDGHEELLYGVH